MSAAPSETNYPNPEVKGGLVAYLAIDGATKAADFYVKAFAAQEVFRYPVDEQGRTMHIHLHINGSSLMLADGYPEHGCPAEKPQGFNLTLQVKNIEQWWQRAVDVGATVVMPLQDMFWGARYGQVRDPFGVLWSFNEPK